MKKVLKKSAVTTIRIAFSASLIYYIVLKIGWTEIEENIRTLDPGAFALVALLFVASVVVTAMRWRLFISSHPGMKKLFGITYVGTFFNTCLPGSIGGDIVRAYYLSKTLKEGSSKDAGTGSGTDILVASNNIIAFGSVLADRYIGMIALLIIGIMATLLGSQYFSDHPVRWFIPVLLGVVIVVSLSIFKLRLGRSFSSVAQFYAYADEIAFKKAEIVKALLYSFVTQLILLCSVYILSRGLSMNVSFVSVVCFVPVVCIISLIPVTISGIGLREGAFVVLFGFIGVLPEKAMTLSVVWFLSIVVGSLPGLILYLFYRGPLKTCTEKTL